MDRYCSSCLSNLEIVAICRWDLTRKTGSCRNIAIELIDPVGQFSGRAHIGEQDGKAFIVMGHFDGTTLKHVINYRPMELDTLLLSFLWYHGILDGCEI